jgi:hypothetical protein
MIKELVVKQQETASVLEKLAEEQGRQGRALKRLFGRGGMVVCLEGSGRKLM